MKYNRKNQKKFSISLEDSSNSLFIDSSLVRNVSCTQEGQSNPVEIYSNDIIRQCENRVMFESFQTMKLRFYAKKHFLYESKIPKYRRACRLPMQAWSDLLGDTSMDNFKDVLIKLSEDIVILVYNLTTSNHYGDIVMAILTFVKMQTSEPLISMENMRSFLNDSENMYRKLVDKIDELLSEFTGKDFPLQADEEGEGPFSKVRNFLDSYDDVKKTSLFQKLYRFYMYALSLSIFSKVGLSMENLGYSKIEQEAVKSKYWAGPDFVHSLMDTIVFLCERGVQCIQTGSMSPLFHSAKGYQKWYDDASELILKKDFLADPEANNICLFKYFGELDTAIEQGQAIYVKAAALGELEKGLVKRTLADLKYIKMTENTRKAAQQLRKPPFSIIISGGTSVAKTQFAWQNARHNAKIEGLPEGDEYIYVRVFADEYYTNFETCMHTIIYDDAAAQSPNLGVMDPSLNELIQIVNSVPYNPNQASLDKKGKTPVRANFVEITTNTPLLNTYAYFSFPVAVNRRFPYVIDIKPKREYCNPNNPNQIDPSRIPELQEGHYLDLWHIQVSDIEARGSMGTLRKIHSFDNIYKYFEWFNQARATFNENQAQSIRATEAVKRVQLCECCKLPQIACRNLPEQGAEFYYTCGRYKCSICHEEVRNCACDSGDANRHYLYKILGQSTASDYTSSSAPSSVPTLESIHSSETSDSVTTQINEYSERIYMALEDKNVLLSKEDNIDRLMNMLEDDIERVHTLNVSAIENRNRISISPQEPIIDESEVLAELKQEFNNTVPFESEEAMFHILDQSVKKNLDDKFKESWTAFIFGKIVTSFFFLYLEVALFRSCANWFYTFPIIRAWVKSLITMRICDTRMINSLCIRVLGERIHRKIGKLNALCVMVGTITSGYIVYKVIKFFANSLMKDKTANKGNEQGNNISKICELDLVKDKVPLLNTGKPPIKTETERENVWYREKYDVTTFDTSLTSMSQVGLDFTEVTSRLMRNCVSMNIFYCDECNYENNECNCSKKKGTSIKGTFIDGQVLMTNAHAFKKELTYQIHLTLKPNVEGVTNNLVIRRKYNEITIYREKDLAFLLVGELPPHKRITDLFVKPTFRGVHKGRYINRDKKGHPVYINMSCVTHMEDYFNYNSEFCGNVWYGMGDRITDFGECGSLLVADTPTGPTILGIHTFGGITKECVAIEVTQDFLKQQIEQYRPQIQCGIPKISSESAKRGLVELHPKSVFRYINKGTANVYGSFSGFHAKPKSRVKDTMMCQPLLHYGYNRKFGAPVMNGYEVWRNAALQSVDPIKNFDNDILDICKNAFRDEILNMLPTSELEQIHVYDNNTAINGAPGVAFVDKINRNTSMGCPFKKSKRWFLEPTEHKIDLEGHYHDVQFNEEIQQRIDNCERTYLKKQRYMPVYCGNLKDEATKMKKIKEKATRVFLGSPAEHVVVVRKYLLSIVRIIQRNKYIFESAPGTVAQSLEWQELREFLTTFGEENCFAGDYKAFDKRMASRFILAAYDILADICKEAGYTQEELGVIFGIAIDTAFPLCDFNGDLVEFFGSNPSGHPLTVIINGLVNCLYMRYACFKIVQEDENTERAIEFVKNFKKFVHLLTYGDDNVANSKDKRINHTSIQAAFNKMGIVYTMADKETESVPFIHIDDCSFLKRTWRYDADVEAFVCPLEHDSIEKMLMTCVASKSVCHEAQCVDIVETAIREYFFYGKSTFEEKKLMLKEICDKLGLQPYYKESTFPTWQSIYEAFWRASAHTRTYHDKKEKMCATLVQTMC